MYKTTQYGIYCRHSGDLIEVCDTLNDAERVLSEYEQQDILDKNFEPNFYEIKEVEE